MLTYLKIIKTDVAFIQETHLKMREHMKLKREWVGHVLALSFISKARAVSILINKNISIIINKTICDPSGSFVMLHCQIHLEPWTLLNIYAP